MSTQIRIHTATTVDRLFASDEELESIQQAMKRGLPGIITVSPNRMIAMQHITAIDILGPSSGPVSR